MPYGEHLGIFFYSTNAVPLTTRLLDILCITLFILGVIGNVLGLFIFSSSRRSWRISSTYVSLATGSSLTNLICLTRYTSVLHSTTRRTLRELVGRHRWACKVYELSFSFRVISSWIVLFWMLERLMCLSIRLRAFFQKCQSFKHMCMFPILMMTAILGWVIGPPVYMFEPRIYLSHTTNVSPNSTKMYCAIHPDASEKWKQYFDETHLGYNHYTIRCLFSELIPTGTIILFDVWIVYYLLQTSRRLPRLHQSQSRTTSWMNIVLVLHSFLFLASLVSHIIGHFTNADAHDVWWVLLIVLANCSLNFYVYCLSGRAFRNELCRFVRRLKRWLFHK